MVHPLYGVLGAVNKRACKVPSTVFSKRFYFAYSLLPKTVAVNYKEGLKCLKVMFISVLNKFLQSFLIKKQWQGKVINWVSLKKVSGWASCRKDCPNNM